MSRVDDRRILNGIFYKLRANVAWADVPEQYGFPTTVYHRFNHWRKTGVWDRLMDEIIKAYGDDIVMIDYSSVRVHQHPNATVMPLTQPDSIQLPGQ